MIRTSIAAALMGLGLMAGGPAQADETDYIKAYTNPLPSTWDGATQYQNYYAGKECVPAGVINTANNIGPGVIEAAERCRKEQDGLDQAAADAKLRVDQLDAVVQSSSTVANATDITAQVTDALGEMSDAGKKIADGMKNRNGQIGNNTAAQKWDKFGKKCGWVKKVSKKTLGRLNLAHSTASGMQWICECAKAQCEDWKEEADEDARNHGGACGKLQEQAIAWSRLQRATACPG